MADEIIEEEQAQHCAANRNINTGTEGRLKRLTYSAEATTMTTMSKEPMIQMNHNFISPYFELQ